MDQLGFKTYNYSKINYPISTDELKGLHNAQIGSIHAIGAQFTVYSKEAALVIMPPTAESFHVHWRGSGNGWWSSHCSPPEYGE